MDVGLSEDVDNWISDNLIERSRSNLMHTFYLQAASVDSPNLNNCTAITYLRGSIKAFRQSSDGVTDYFLK